jgi:hypothetical protein
LGEQAAESKSENRDPISELSFPKSEIWNPEFEIRDLSFEALAH